MTFDPSNGQFRLHWEKRTASGLFLPGIPYGEDPIDECITQENLSNESTIIESNCLTASDQRSEGLPGKFTSSGDFETEVEPESFAYWIAAFQRNGRTPTVLTAAQSWRHILAPSETDVAFPKSFMARVFRDDGFIQTLLNVQPSQLQLTISPDNLLVATLQVLWERSTYYSFAIVDTEAVALAINARPWVRGLPTHAQWTATPAGAPTVHVRVQAGPQWQSKLGDSGTWDDVTPVDGGWIDLLDGSGNVIGDPSAPVQMYIVAQAAAAVNDQWHFDMLSLAAWSPGLPPLSSMSEVDAIIQLDAAEYPLESVTLTYTKPREPNRNIGGRFADGIRDNGQRNIAGALDARYLDDSVRRRLETGEPFSLELIASSPTVIGASTDKYRFSAYHPRCKFNGRAATIAGSNEYNQAAAFDCYPDATDPLPDDVSFTLDNGISDLTV